MPRPLRSSLTRQHPQYLEIPQNRDASHSGAQGREDGASKERPQIRLGMEHSGAVSLDFSDEEFWVGLPGPRCRRFPGRDEDDGDLEVWNVEVVVLADAGGGEATSRYLPSTERRCGTYRESESQLAYNVAPANDKPEMDPLPELLSAGASAAVSTVRWLFVWHLIARNGRPPRLLSTPPSAAQRADPGFVAAGGRPHRRLRLIWALLSSGASAARAA
ncbi:hypothetical protein CKAH01_04083 [Colletotrichum kahawae]|uniref:Uncharacterized protein n=1 Tax=Colletotrichum kahawae TaxID=34407 RepID=A0AAD9YLB2_COLKA|nr:hypothetical protein CKAH01_04083 [Colletotrichum kahawae]